MPCTAKHSNLLFFKHKQPNIYSCRKSSLHTAVYAIYGYDKHRAYLNSVSVAEMGSVACCTSCILQKVIYWLKFKVTKKLRRINTDDKTISKPASLNAGMMTNIHVSLAWMPVKALLAHGRAINAGTSRILDVMEETRLMQQRRGSPEGGRR